MKLFNTKIKPMEFLKPQRKVKEDEKSFIKESDKTKLFVNKEGCYVSNDRQDTGEYREYEISSLVEIREETVAINEKDEYIILYENSKGEDILVSGKKNRDYGQGKFRIGKSAKMITQKGLQLVYNLNTKVLHERKTTVKLEFVLEEKPEETLFDYKEYYHRKTNDEIRIGVGLHDRLRDELIKHRIGTITMEPFSGFSSGPISSYNTELKITTPDEQYPIKRKPTSDGPLE